MKGCLNRLIWFLIFAFIILFAFKYFAQSNTTMDSVMNTISESGYSISENFSDVDENITISNVLQSFGINTEKPEPPAVPTSYKPGLTDELVLYPSEPHTVEDFRKVLLYMANQNILELKINYDDSYKVVFEDSNITQNNLSTAFDQVVVEYVDLFSGVVESQYQMEGNIFACSLTINLNSNIVDDTTLIQNQVYFEQAALNINTSLYQDGTLKESMSQRQKAKALYSYVTKNYAYDTTLNKESYTGYGAVKNKTAVCQGYTALYNYLLKLNNIDCYGQAGIIIESNTQHIWTVATLDGVPTYIDVTFGDPTPDTPNYTDYTYFDVSKEFLLKSRTGVE